MTRHKVDAIDVELLTVLQQNGRTKRSELAERVDLSIPSVSDRLKKLEEMGILRGYLAQLEPRAVGLEVAAFIVVASESSKYFDGIVEAATNHPSVLECHSVTGDGSHLLKVRTQNTASLEKLLSEIQRWPGVTNTRTNIVLSTQKETTALPLTHMVRS
jgi:Lrp/AsnC family leucine-responsive transcriptional regulator